MKHKKIFQFVPSLSQLSGEEYKTIGYKTIPSFQVKVAHPGYHEAIQSNGLSAASVGEKCLLKEASSEWSGQSRDVANALDIKLIDMVTGVCFIIMLYNLHMYYIYVLYLPNIKNEINF